MHWHAFWNAVSVSDVRCRAIELIIIRQVAPRKRIDAVTSQTRT